jgi:hypothetical protein
MIKKSTLEGMPKMFFCGRDYNISGMKKSIFILPKKRLKTLAAKLFSIRMIVVK